MIDHVSLGVIDFKQAQAFYKAVLKPLGFRLLMTYGEASGFGTGGRATFWIGTPGYSGGVQGAGTHVAFAAPARKSVDAFYKAALKRGAKDNGKPGLRPHYHKDFYGAFVVDADGHRIEAVCRKPVPKTAAKARAKAKSKTKTRQ